MADFMDTHDLANLTTITSVKVGAAPAGATGAASLLRRPCSGCPPGKAARQPQFGGPLGRRPATCPAAAPLPALQDLHNSMDAIESAFCKKET